jgi:tetratricopeptide (TPR) repeat protein
MSRGWTLVLCALSFSALLPAQQKPAPADTETQQIDPGQLPPDEDKANAKEEIVFNPVTSKHDVAVGDEYFKKGNFRAAAARYRDATKFNEGNADAWLRLGDAEDRMHDAKAAKEAWERYLQLAPEAKNAAEVKKKLAKLKG